MAQRANEGRNYRAKAFFLPVDSPFLCQNPIVHTGFYMSTPTSRPDQSVTFRLPRRSLQIAAIAFGIGLLLFVLVWLSARKNNDFYRADPSEAGTPTVDMAPLPEPLPAGAGASHMPDAKQVPVEERPQLVEEAIPPPPPMTPQAVEQLPQTEPNAARAIASGNEPRPMPDQSPAPQYPTEALRRGESGTVVVQVQVDAAGNPADARITQRSGSRLLDRAALDAVRRWRFQPAMVEGQPVPGTLEIPFDFKTQQ